MADPTEIQDLGVIVVFNGERGVSVGVLVDVMQSVNNAAFVIALEEMHALRRQRPEFRGEPLEIALERLRRFRGDAVRFERVQSGSIVLIGVVTGLTIWLLQQTFGETLSEAWKASDLHQALRDFMTTQINNKTRRLSQIINRNLRERGVNAEATPQVDRGNLVVVTIPEPRDSQVPSLRDVLKPTGS